MHTYMLLILNPFPTPSFLDYPLPIQTPRFETRCTVYNRELGPIWDLGLSGFCYRGKGNRGLGPVGVLGLGAHVGLHSGSWVNRGFCYRGKGNRELGPVGELG